MPSFEHGEPHGYWSDLRPKPPQWHNPTQKPHVPEAVLFTAEVQIERKVFSFQIRENSRGRILRITENGNGKRNCIIVPATGLNDFGKLLSEMVEAARQTPEK